MSPKRPTNPLRRVAARLSPRRVLRRAWRGFMATMARLDPRIGEPVVRSAELVLSLVSSRPDRRGDYSRLALVRARTAYDAGNLPAAREELDRLVSEHPEAVTAMKLRGDVLRDQGELTERVRNLHRLHAIVRDEAERGRERLTLGRLVETDPRWLPRVPGPARPVEPASDRVVLHLLKESAPWLTNGFTMRSRYNLLASVEAGIEPVVVTALGFPRVTGQTTVEPVELVDGIPHHRLDLGPHYSMAQPVDRVLEDHAWLAAGVARKVRPALIHASSGNRGYDGALVGLALRDHLQRPLVYEVRSFFEATWSSDAEWNHVGEQFERRFAAETRAMLEADHVITIAEAMREDIIERGVPAERITVVPNGVDAAEFAPQPADPALRRRYGLDGRFVFGYISNLDHRRENQELLVDATAILLRRGRAVTCLIVGDGRRREEIERRAEAQGVGDAVVFTGSVPHDQVGAHYALLDAFVVPRRWERAAAGVTPLKPYEALAMERPLVVSDLPALLEIAEPEERGLAFPADDADALATTLERLMDEPDLGPRIAAAGRAWVARERSWSSNGERLAAIYRGVLERWAAGERTPRVATRGEAMEAAAEEAREGAARAAERALGGAA